jgi:hypothetical protein
MKKQEGKDIEEIRQLLHLNCFCSLKTGADLILCNEDRFTKNLYITQQFRPNKAYKLLDKYREDGLPCVLVVNESGSAKEIHASWFGFVDCKPKKNKF